MEAWNLKQLYEALQSSIVQCQTSHEKIMCNAIGGKEIREKAIEWAATRKLTPMEVGIAQQFGYKGN